mgnify:CR=1 FL=1
MNNYRLLAADFNHKVAYRISKDGDLIGDILIKEYKDDINSFYNLYWKKESILNEIHTGAGGLSVNSIEFFIGVPAYGIELEDGSLYIKDKNHVYMAIVRPEMIKNIRKEIMRSYEDNLYIL